MSMKIKFALVAAVTLVAAVLVCARTNTFSAIQMFKLNGESVMCTDQHDLAQCAEENRPCLVGQVVKLLQVGVVQPVSFCQTSDSPATGVVTQNSAIALNATLKATFKNPFGNGQNFVLNVLP